MKDKHTEKRNPAVIKTSNAIETQSEKLKDSAELAIPTQHTNPTDQVVIMSIDDNSLESCIPSSESLLYDCRSKLMSNDPISLLSITPLSISASSTASIPSSESIVLPNKIPNTADLSTSLLTLSNAPSIPIKMLEDNPELMIVMNRIEALLLSACKRTAILLQEAIRQREETIMTNEVESRNFNESTAMKELKEYEKTKKDDMEDLEIWYEDEVKEIKQSYADQLEQYEKELEDYRTIYDPPERASRIRSQVLERYHNKLSSGEDGIQQKIHVVKVSIQQAIKNVEREYQKQKRIIEKDFLRASHTIKEQLIENKHTIRTACTNRREAARILHTKTIKTCHDILNEVLSQARDLLHTFEETCINSFPLSSIYLSNSIMNQTITLIVFIKNMHLFCSIRVHEQVKKIASIQNDIDSFQSNCDNIIISTKMHDNEKPSTESDSFRADVFLQSTLKLQSEYIGQALLDINDDIKGFHNQMATLREQFTNEIASYRENAKQHGRNNRKHDSFDSEAFKKKYITIITQCAKEELEMEFKHCVQDIVDYATTSSRLYYREMSYRYWLLFNEYKEQKESDSIYELLTAANQEMLERFITHNEKNLFHVSQTDE